MNCQSIETDDKQIFLTHTGHEILPTFKIEEKIRMYNFYGYIGNFENNGLNNEYDDVKYYYCPTCLKVFKHTSEFRVDPVPDTGKIKLNFVMRESASVGHELRMQSKFKSEGHKIRTNTQINIKGYDSDNYKYLSERSWKNNKQRKQWMSNKFKQSIKSKNIKISHKKSLKTVLNDTQNYDDHIRDVNMWFFVNVDCARPEYELQKNRKYLKIDGSGLYSM